MIDQFTIADFEAAIAKYKPKSLGLRSGEYTYEIEIGAAFLIVRSSIDRTGRAQDAGQNSIRLALLNNAGFAITEKKQAYITRTSGWADRLIAAIDVYIEHVAQNVRLCPKCKKEAATVFVSASAKNPGKRYWKCTDYKGCGAWICWEGQERVGWAPNTNQNQNSQTGTQDVRAAVAEQLNSPKQLPLATAPIQISGSATVSPVAFNSTSAKDERLSAQVNDGTSTAPTTKVIAETTSRKSVFVPSTYQRAFFLSLIRDSRRNIVLEALAGSGKSRTIQEAIPLLTYAVAYAKGTFDLLSDEELGDILRGQAQLAYPPDMSGISVRCLAFNAKIAETLQAILPRWANASTIHSMCLSFYTKHRNIKRPNLDNQRYKVANFVKDLQTLVGTSGIPLARLVASVSAAATKDKKVELVKAVVKYFGQIRLSVLMSTTFHLSVEDKYVDIIAKLPEVIHLDGNSIVRLCNLCKNCLMEPTPENLTWLIDRYSVEILSEEPELVYLATSIAFESTTVDFSEVDFNDLVYWVARGVIPAEKFDFIFVDETQDLDTAQLEAICRCCKPTTRVILVGDRNQSIYGFKAADADAIPKIIKRLNAKVLPLSITYRCSIAIVEAIKRHFPSIQIEAAENAIQGFEAHADLAAGMPNFISGDWIVCRTNAPLVPLAHAVLREGKKAVILGRDIGKGLIRLAQKVAKANLIPEDNLPELIKALQEYMLREVAKLLAAKKEGQATKLADEVETIIALTEGLNSLSELVAKVNSIFSDDAAGIVFSSIHKAKGGEVETRENTIYILRPDLLPHPMAKKDWEKEQEDHLLYVAMSRGKNGLVWLQDSNAKKTSKKE